MTEYTILKRVDKPSDDAPDGYWNPIGVAKAGNPLAAAKAFLAIGDNGETFGEGEYRGVAVSSWGDAHPIKRKVSFG